MAHSGFLVADEARIERVLDDLARRIHAVHGPELRVVGIRRRGVPVAEVLARRLGSLGGRQVPLGTIELERYADDLTLLHDEPQVGAIDLPFEPGGATVLIVDDVLYSGRTFLEAVAHLVRAGAMKVELAALCARGASEVPVRADFVGLRLDVGESDVIEVRAPPYEATWEVRLFHREDLRATG
jgi:pyrimidine operon attenuation protein / uracil phosphoribosyltransferase